MARKNAIELNLPGANELFTTQEERNTGNEERVIKILLSEITDFPDYSFKVKMDEEMLDMVDSVKQYGVLVPALVRPKPDGSYEMIDGHRRKMAGEIAEKVDITCIIRDVSDDEAVIIMVDSNLQREKILRFEKAFDYKMKLDAMKR